MHTSKGPTRFACLAVVLDSWLDPQMMSWMLAFISRSCAPATRLAILTDVVSFPSRLSTGSPPLVFPVKFRQSSSLTMNTILRCVSDLISGAVDWWPFISVNVPFVFQSSPTSFSASWMCSWAYVVWSQGQPKQCAMYLLPLSSVYSQMKGDGQVDVYAV